MNTVDASFARQFVQCLHAVVDVHDALAIGSRAVKPFDRFLRRSRLAMILEQKSSVLRPRSKPILNA
jgi:hypothetical protein